MELNKTLLIGRLVRDPELRYIPSGTAICEFTLASDRKTGADKEKEVLFIKVSAWGKTGEFVNDHFAKGSAIFVEGRLRREEWTDKDGNKKDRICIVAERVQFAESKAEADARRGKSGDDGEMEPEHSPAPRNTAQPSRRVAADPVGSDDNDLPF